MALSGSFTNYFQGNASRFHMTTSWSATQNIANNTSTITAITTVRPEGAIGSTASKNGSITIAGNTKNFTFVLGSIGAGVTKEVGRHTFTFSHASNGTGSAAISSTLGIIITYSGKSLGSLSTSGTASLNTIPRTSTFTIPSSFNVGSAFTVTISRASSSFTHEISLIDGSTGFYWSGNNVATSGSPNVAADTLLARMSGVKSKVFTVRVTTYNGSTPIGSTTKTITANIPVSTFTIPTSFTMGSAFSVSISRVGSLTHWVILYDGSTSVYSSGNTIGTSDSVNVALSTLAARSPNAMSKTFTVQVDTYNGGTQVGRQSKTITANVPTSVKPTFSALTVSENVSTVASLVGAYVQTKSKLNLAITGAGGIHGSTIKSYNITGVGHNVNSSSTVTGLLSVSGNQTIKGTVIDSRGQSFERSVVVNILPYTPPTLSGLSFRRTLPDKTEAPLGDNATVRASVKVHSLIVNGVQKNSIKYNVQSAQSGGSFADKANTTSTDLTKNYSDVWVGYSVDHSYNFRVRAGDVFGFGSWSVGVVPTGVVTQQWGSKTTSFGKMIDNTSYNVQVGSGGIQSDGDIVYNGTEKIGTTTLSSSTDPNTTTTTWILSNHANSPASIAGGYWYITTVFYSSKSNNRSQMAIGYHSTQSGRVFTRTMFSNEWSAWRELAGTDHTHAASAITSGTFADARIPNLNASKITAGTIADARLPAKAKPTDFVIEQGTYYTKWNSGKLEQWGNISINQAITASYGTLFRSADNNYLPFAIPYVGVPTTIINATFNSSFGAYLNEVTSHGFTWRPLHVFSQTLTVRVSWYAVGRWK